MHASFIAMLALVISTAPAFSAPLSTGDTLAARDPENKLTSDVFESASPGVNARDPEPKKHHGADPLKVFSDTQPLK
ncbi:hypothetical protein V8E53_009060 [Lactarius tabidus]